MKSQFPKTYAAFDGPKLPRHRFVDEIVVTLEKNIIKILLIFDYSASQAH